MQYSLGELAKRFDVELNGDPETVITGVGTLDEAGQGDLTFLANPKYAAALDLTSASAVVVAPEYRRQGKAQLVASDPYLTFVRAVALFNPPVHPGKGVSQGAFVDAAATLGQDVVVMDGARIEAGATVGDRTVIYSGSYVGVGASVGSDCVLYPNATVRERCVLHDRVILQPGCVIGSDGFGFASGPEGHEKFPQVGIVRLEDDVEVGANTTIDRAALGETRIGKGTKIDNLVMIAHNVIIGEHSLVVGQAGVSGSAKLGNRVILAGQVGVAGHITVGDGAIIGGQSGVTSNVEAGAKLSGMPAINHGDWLRAGSVFKHLPTMNRTIKKMEKKIAKLEALLEAGQGDTEE